MGFWELLLIVGVILLFFGAGRLPAVGEGLGKAIRAFREQVRSAPGATPAAKKDLPPRGGAGE